MLRYSVNLHAVCFCGTIGLTSLPFMKKVFLKIIALIKLNVKESKMLWLH